MYKKVEAYIRPEKLQQVKEALHEAGIVGMTARNVQGHGRQGGVELAGRTKAYVVDWLDRVELMVIVSTHNLELTIQTICKAAHTQHSGDGMIFIPDVADAVRINNDRGADAMRYSNDVDNKNA